MRTIIVTGSAGLIGSETVKRCSQDGAHIVGIDNDLRSQFFGAEASTKETRDNLIANVRGYEHHNIDIRDAPAVTDLFKQHGGKIDAIVHTASQPSHDWAPRLGEVYNIGGSRHCYCSMLEAIEMCEKISGRKLTWHYEAENRIGDHIWWISDVRKFQQHYPAWKFRYDLREILEEIHRAVAS